MASEHTLHTYIMCFNDRYVPNGKKRMYALILLHIHRNIDDYAPADSIMMMMMGRIIIIRWDNMIFSKHVAQLVFCFCPSVCQLSSRYSLSLHCCKLAIMIPSRRSRMRLIKTNPPETPDRIGSSLFSAECITRKSVECMDLVETIVRTHVLFFSCEQFEFVRPNGRFCLFLEFFRRWV